MEGVSPGGTHGAEVLSVGSSDLSDVSAALCLSCDIFASGGQLKIKAKKVQNARACSEVDKWEARGPDIQNEGAI